MWPVESASGCCSEIPVGKAFASDTVDTILVMEAMEFGSRTLAVDYQWKRTDEQDEPRVIFSLAPTPPPIARVAHTILEKRISHACMEY